MSDTPVDPAQALSLAIHAELAREGTASAQEAVEAAFGPPWLAMQMENPPTRWAALDQEMREYARAVQATDLLTIEDLQGILTFRQGLLEGQES